MNMAMAVIHRADTYEQNFQRAVDELSQKLDFSHAALTLFFCGKHYSNAEFAAAITRSAGNSLVIGCTTAGEITTSGYSKNSISAVSFPSASFSAQSHLLHDLKNVTVKEALDAVERLKFELGFNEKNASEFFALFFIDGLSITEEPVTFKLQDALGQIPLLGGSAGDELNFKSTEIYSDGNFCSDSAVLILVRTSRPWEIFKEQHFTPTNKKAVVTEVDSEKRIIYELNGGPAAEELAELLGLNGPEEITQEILVKNPLMVCLGDNWFIRSILSVNADDSLTCYCAIERGMVFSIGKNCDLVQGLENRFKDIRSRLNDIQFTLACDCILRRLELESTNTLEKAGAVLANNNVIGFSTYGEQFGSVHINQTLTGIAIG